MFTYLSYEQAINAKMFKRCIFIYIFIHIHIYSYYYFIIFYFIFILLFSLCYIHIHLINNWRVAWNNALNANFLDHIYNIFIYLKLFYSVECHKISFSNFCLLFNIIIIIFNFLLTQFFFHNICKIKLNFKKFNLNLLIKLNLFKLLFMPPNLYFV